MRPTTSTFKMKEASPMSRTYFHCSGLQCGIMLSKNKGITEWMSSRDLFFSYSPSTLNDSTAFAITFHSLLSFRCSNCLRIKSLCFSAFSKTKTANSNSTVSLFLATVRNAEYNKRGYFNKSKSINAPMLLRADAALDFSGGGGVTLKHQ